MKKTTGASSSAPVVISLDDIERRVIGCQRCPELRAYTVSLARKKKPMYADQTYWGKPVPAFGDPCARVMLVGLAPGAHGSNRTGRPFTGDASGDFLYPALYRAGFASKPTALSREDGMQMHDCIITAAARCAPPQNKPLPAELQNCLPFLIEEFDALPQLRVMIGLGSIGFNAIIKTLLQRGFSFEGSGRPKFGHLAEYEASSERRSLTLLGSYHPSRQNTNTGVLTVAMFDAVFARAAGVLNGSAR